MAPTAAQVTIKSPSNTNTHIRCDFTPVRWGHLTDSPKKLNQAVPAVGWSTDCSRIIQCSVNTSQETSAPCCIMKTIWSCPRGTWGICLLPTRCEKALPTSAFDAVLGRPPHRLTGTLPALCTHTSQLVIAAFTHSCHTQHPFGAFAHPNAPSSQTQKHTHVFPMSTRCIQLVYTRQGYIRGMQPTLQELHNLHGFKGGYSESRLHGRVATTAKCQPRTFLQAGSSSPATPARSNTKHRYMHCSPRMFYCPPCQ
jgi:hypothetical protein